MHSLTTVRPVVLASLLAVLSFAMPMTQFAQAQGVPKYEDAEAKRIVERMLQAHGSADAWFSAPTFQFTAAMYLASLPVADGRTYFDNWRYYTVTIQPQTSRGMVELPFETEEVVIGFDGSTLWAREYQFDPSFRDGPLQLLYYHYAMISLPWLTQQQEVSIRSAGSEPLPLFATPHHVLEMSFHPEGKIHEGGFRLYIDPESYRLRGFSQTVSYPFLPGDIFAEDVAAGGFPNMYRVVEAYTEVDGFVIPRSYATVVADDEGLKLMGSHLVLNPSFENPLPDDLLAKPSGAQVVFERNAP